jgi:hypothetical protein
MNEFIARSLGLLLALASMGASAAAVVHRDPFDGAPTLPWTSVRGAWQVTAGQYVAQAPGNLPPTAALLPYDVADFSFEVDVIDPADGGLWVRTNADASAGVLLVVFPDRLYWHVISDPISGPYTAYGEAPIAPPLGSGGGRIRVTGDGAILRAYVDERPLAITTLDLAAVTSPPGLNYLRGRVGLYDNAVPGTRFDNVRLEVGRPIEVMAIGDPGTNTVKLFPVDAAGDVAPLRTLGGVATGLVDVRGVAMDADWLWVSSGTGSYIRAYPLGDVGNIAPARSIAGPATGLGAVYQISRVGRELFVASDTGPVSVFDADVGGDIPPLRKLDAMTGAYAVDTSAGELFIARHFVDSRSVYAYADTAAGAAPPLRHLTGAATGLGTANLGLASSPESLVIVQYLEAQVRIYARGADGDTAPLRTIAGLATGLGAPVDVALRGGELYVANSGYGNVLVFPANADGNVTPTRILGGPGTGFNAPFAIAFGVYVLPDAVFIDGFE